MPNTEESILENGIPEIEMDVELFQMVQTAVDKTLSIPDMAADAKAVGDALDDVQADISQIMQQTAEDVPMAPETGAPTVAAFLRGLYQIGAIYATASGSLPEVLGWIGTWEEIKIPMTWNDLKNGTRSYESIESGDSVETIRFWIRTA